MIGSSDTDCGGVVSLVSSVRLDAKLGQLRGEVLRTFGTWLFASQAVVIAAVSVLVAIA